MWSQESFVSHVFDTLRLQQVMRMVFMTKHCLIVIFDVDDSFFVNLHFNLVTVLFLFW